MSTLEKTIDVIVPVFNGAPYLAETIGSILEQEHPGVNIIVIDDGSTDSSVDIARRFSNVHVLQQENQGPAAARNAGIRVGEAPYIAFLDADDLWTPNKLNRQLDALHADETLDMVFGGMDYFYSPELAPQDYPHKPAPQEKGQLISALLVRRSSLMSVGLLHEDLKFGEFIDWYHRAMSAGLKADFVEGTVFFRRLHANNYTRRQTDVKKDYLKLIRAKLLLGRTDGGE